MKVPRAYTGVYIPTRRATCGDNKSAIREKGHFSSSAPASIYISIHGACWHCAPPRARLRGQRRVISMTARLDANALLSLSRTYTYILSVCFATPAICHPLSDNERARISRASSRIVIYGFAARWLISFGRGVVVSRCRIFKTILRPPRYRSLSEADSARTHQWADTGEEVIRLESCRELSCPRVIFPRVVSG